MKLSRKDLWSLEEYAEKRAEFRAEVIAHKKHRQIALGPHATLYLIAHGLGVFKIQGGVWS